MIAKSEISDNKSHTVGRTALQKLVYFETLKIPNTISYIPHYYGPFSRDVAVELEGLVAIGYIDEKVIFAHTHESYLYDLTDDGKRLAGEDKKTDHNHYHVVKDIVNQCAKFCNLQPSVLSYAAKAYYILSRANQSGKKSITSSDVKKVGQSFGWNISEVEAENGLELLSKLKLVKQHQE